MNILIAILLILNLSATVYLIAALHERTNRFRRDIDALAKTVRRSEEAVQLYIATFDYQIRVLNKKVFDLGDTGFNIEHLTKN